MPLKLIPPREGRSPNYTIRGTYLGVSVDRSAGTGDKRVATRALRAIREQIESGAFAGAGALTFAGAAAAYMKAGGERQFLAPLLRHFRDTPAANIDQAAIDAAATAVYPDASPATRNRQVYTPVSAVLRHAGVHIVLKRPKGAQGAARTDFLWPDQANAVFAAATDDPEWRAFLTLLCYTGLRLGEALKLTCNNIRLADAKAICGKTKNGDPRGIHLPPVVVAELGNLPAGLERGEARVFPAYRKGEDLYDKLKATFASAQVALPARMGFHIFRHTYGTWMRMYGGLSREGLVETGVWRSASAAGRYDHADVSAAARAADRLPTVRRA
jgi:integrase